MQNKNVLGWLALLLVTAIFWMSMPKFVEAVNQNLKEEGNLKTATYKSLQATETSSIHTGKIASRDTRTVSSEMSIAVGDTNTVQVPVGGVTTLSLNTNQTVTITARALDDSDPVLKLLDTQGNVLASNDDHNTNFAELSPLDSAITRYTVPSSITIEISEFGFNGSNIEVSVAEAEAIVNPTSIAVGETLTVITRHDETVPLTLNTNQTVTIIARALNDADTVLTVLDRNGNEIAYNDDHDTNIAWLDLFDSAILNLNVSGSVTIEVGEYYGDMGEIVISVIGEGNVPISPDRLDVTNDNLIAPTDAVFVLNRMGQTVNSSNESADIDSNGIINAVDVQLIINALGITTD